LWLSQWTPRDATYFEQTKSWKKQNWPINPTYADLSYLEQGILVVRFQCFTGLSQNWYLGPPGFDELNKLFIADGTENKFHI
jgi:hypothetical protein